MPRVMKDESEDENGPKIVGRRKKATGPPVVDSPLRRSTRNRQISYNVEGSSPESVVSDAAGPLKRTTRANSSTTDNNRPMRLRKNSAASDISEITDNDLETRRVTRRRSAAPFVPDTPTKSRLTRSVRAGSESNTLSPSVRVTRRTRASSVDDDGRENVKSFDSSNSNGGTPMKMTRKRASVQPSEPPVSEEPLIVRKKKSLSRRVIQESDEDGSEKSNSSSNLSRSLNSSTISEKNTPVKSPLSREKHDSSKVTEIVDDSDSNQSVQEIVQEKTGNSLLSGIVPNQTHKSDEYGNLDDDDDDALKQKLMINVIENSTQNYPKVVIEKTISENSIEIIETSPSNKENEKFNRIMPERKFNLQQQIIKSSEKNFNESTTTIVERLTVDRNRNNLIDEKMMKFVEIIEVPLNSELTTIFDNTNIETKEHSIISIDDNDDNNINKSKIEINNEDKINEIKDGNLSIMINTDIEEINESKCDNEIIDEKNTNVDVSVNSSTSINLSYQMNESAISRENEDESDIILSVSLNDSLDVPQPGTRQFETESTEDNSSVKNIMSSIVAGNENEKEAAHIDGSINSEDKESKTTTTNSLKKTPSEDGSIDDPEDDVDMDVENLFRDIPADDYEEKETNKITREVSECDSVETVILSDLTNVKSPRKSALFEEPMEIDEQPDTDVDENLSEDVNEKSSSEKIDDEGEKLNVSRKSIGRRSVDKTGVNSGDLHKSIISWESSDEAEKSSNDTRDSVGSRKSLDKKQENLDDSCKSVGRKSLNDQDSILNDSCKSVGRKSLEKEKEESVDDSRKSLSRKSLDKIEENQKETRDSIGSRKSLDKSEENLNVSRKSLNRKSSSEKIEENENNIRDSVGSRKSLDKSEENLNVSRKSLNRKSSSEKIEENQKETRDSIGSRKSLDKSEENLNVSRKSLNRKSSSEKIEENENNIRESIGSRKSLDNKQKNLDDSRKSFDGTEENLNVSRKSLSRKSSSEKIEENENNIRESVGSRKSLDNQQKNLDDSRKSLDKTEENLNISRKSLSRKSLDKIEENQKDSRESVGSRKSLDNKQKNLNDSRKSIGRKSLNDEEEITNDSRKSIGRKSLSNGKEIDSRKSVGRKSLKNMEKEDLNDSEKSAESVENEEEEEENLKDTRKSLGRKSLDKKEENLNESRKSIGRKSMAKEESLNKSNLEKSEDIDADDEISISTPLEKSLDKNQRKSLNKSLKTTPKQTPSKKQKKKEKDDSSEDAKSDDSSSELNGSRIMRMDEISTLVQLNSDSEEDSLNSEESDSDAKIMPSFLYACNTDSDDDDDSNEVNSDIEKEYNLNGESSLKYSDDDVPGDDCRASESDSSDSDDDAEDLADFVVDDDEEDEEESEEEEEEEKDDEESDEDIELVVEEQDDEENNSIGASEKSLSQISESGEVCSNNTSKNEINSGEEDSEEDNEELVEEEEEEKVPIKLDNLNDSKKIIKKIRTESMDSSTPKSNSSDRVALGIDTPRPVFDKNTKKNIISSIKGGIEAPPKFQGSFKEPKTPKSILETSLPKSKEKIKQLDKAKLATTNRGLNHSTIEKTNGSPEERQLMKEKLNDTLPPIKLQQKIKASRRSQLDDVTEGGDESLVENIENIESLNESKKNTKKNKKNNSLIGESGNESLDAEIIQKKCKSQITNNSPSDVIKESKKSKKRKQIVSEEEESRIHSDTLQSNLSTEFTKKDSDKVKVDKVSKKQKVDVQNLKNQLSNDSQVTKTIKRLPTEFLENLSDSVERPKKKQKLANGMAKMMPSRSMFASPLEIPDNMSIDDDFLPLATSGGTTQFNVVDLRKPKKSKKTAAAFNFRERMIARNPRQPISAYLMYQQKLKASGKGKH